ncbi:Ubiquitin carboxyl-terminal hydrolase CYLD [Stylophora pistillata]|uniref:ubiquitinyl hydrolase 1 n=1 Tax=Stylophora pistillata TaxID=50429 RepID=A0A2B4RVQ6_STYPI|nr:Ubiquitin carboxyl-terminal hydrolase CYLD [Stylophora pistillata]
MEEPSVKYILLRDRVGHTVGKSLLSLGLRTKSAPLQVLRGEILEGVPAAEQPTDLTKVAVVGIERKSLRLECRTDDMTRLSEEEANLLLAISSSERRYQTFIDRKRLAFGGQLLPGSAVFVEVKGISKVLPGVVWYKGELPPSLGTWFGVELIKNPGSGTCDGTFRNKQYFTCARDSGVFVGLDKLTPREDEDDIRPSKISKKDENKLKSSLKDSILSFWKGKHEQRSFQGIDGVLKTDERVVTFINDTPARGTVRYIAEEKDSMGNSYIIVGLELDERVGSGCGKRFGFQKFICKRDYAAFVPLKTVMPEKDFDKKPERATRQEAQGKKEQNHEGESYPKSMSHVNLPSATRKESVMKLRRTNSMTSAETELIVAAGESSKTDPQEFIEKQRQMFREFEGKNIPDNQDNDVTMQDEERTDSAENFHIKDDHFKSTPQDRSVSDGTKIITEQPGLSNGNLVKNFDHQDTTQEYDSDYVNIGKDGSQTLIRKHEQHGEYKEHLQSAAYLTSQRSPTFKEEVKHLNQGTHNSDGSVATAKFVADRKSSDRAEAMEVEMERETSSKEPLEQPYAQSHTSAFLGDDLAVNRRTGGSDIMSVDNHCGLEVGSMVEVPVADGAARCGVIRWIGIIPQVKGKLVAGLELEEEESACSDGTFNKERYFTCPAGRGFFVLLENCRPDSRFANSQTASVSLNAERDFGSMPSPEEEGITEPPKALEDKYCGLMRGLQGHHNSCYLDATLFSMFAFTSVFDTLLHRPRKDDDLEEYNKVQSVLRNWIVNPLRVHGFVRADRLLALRQLLDQLSSTAGLTNEEKDPEEFLNSLLQQVLKADPFLHLKPRDVQEKKGEGAFLYQIIPDKDETVKIAQVQTMLEQSFISADLILFEMPRFGNRYKMYDMILPNLELDVTHIVENVPRECNMCGSDVAQYECKKCYQKGLLKDEPGIACYCKGCNEKVHAHRNRQDHKPKPILLPRIYSHYSDQAKTVEKQLTLDKQKMDLFAVVCIETSHYVAFVKCGMEKDAPWCFFDSMADRKGERNGYNIPAVTRCPEALEWLSKSPEEIIAAKERGEMPEKVRRLLGDGYLCMYQNLDMTMYK